MRTDYPKTGPKCIYCHRGIPRTVRTIWVRSSDPAPGLGRLDVTGDLRSLDDCRKHAGSKHVYAPRQWHGLIYRYSVWDGQTFRDHFFCSDNCAKLFGYTAAGAGWRVTA